jgi:hypothetical protein
MATVSLKCRCGALRGAATGVSPATGNRVVCMCDDCQAYAKFLGRSDEILDANGGTDIFQMTPSQVTFSAGQENIACMRLSPKGLMRWYAKCCNTPVANTLASAKIPFVGVPQPFMDHQSDGAPREEVLGPIVARVHGRFGHGALPEGTHKRFPAGLLLRSLRLVLMAWFRGRQNPSPFFGAGSGEPVAAPIVLTPEERQNLAA